MEYFSGRFLRNVQLVTKSDKSFLLFAAIRAKKTAISPYGAAMLTERTHIKYSDDIKIT